MTNTKEINELKNIVAMADTIKERSYRLIKKMEGASPSSRKGSRLGNGMIEIIAKRRKSLIIKN